MARPTAGSSSTARMSARPGDTVAMEANLRAGREGVEEADGRLHVRWHGAPLGERPGEPEERVDEAGGCGPVPQRLGGERRGPGERATGAAAKPRQPERVSNLCAPA